MKTKFTQVLIVAAGLIALPLLSLAAGTVLPLVGSQWQLYDLGAVDRCGVSVCGSGQYPGTLADGGGVYFNFPNAPDVPVGEGTQYTDWRGYMVTQPSQHKFNSLQTLTLNLEVDTTGSPVFGYHSNSDNTCNTPATVRPYFQSGNLFSTNKDGSNRWWAGSSNSYVLADGTATINVPLQPEFWSDTFGKAGNADTITTKEFNQTIGNIRWLGVTMGGGCFFGHGVNISGDGATAQFIIKSYSIQ